MLRRLPLILTVVPALIWPSILLAENDIYVPDSLKPWVEWVLEDNPHVSCPVRATDGIRLNCIWVRATNVNVLRGETFGATFELQVHAFAESTLQLPYSGSFKPQNFTLNGQEIALGGGNSAPEVQVPVGTHSLKGELLWTEESEPRFLEIPQSGIVRLTIDGEPVKHPTLRAGGSRLWFSSEITEEPSTNRGPDTEIVRVFRHFIDDIPQTLTTYIRVTVTGGPRTLDFGQVLSEEYEITSLSSRWPAILSREGNLVVQVSPGTNDIQIDARATNQLNSFKYHKASDLWPNLEYWGIEPRHELRVLRMEGAPRTDLSQINAPRRMRQLNGFVLSKEDELELIEEQRGSVEPYASTFYMTRNLWLNFRGDSYTVADSISTEVESAQRVTSSITLGEVRVNGSSRLITYDNTSEDRLTSIYLTPNDSSLSSISKVSRSDPLLANTWSVEAESLRTRLHLPPGWLLLWSHGVDEVDGSWLSNWGIWDVFIVLLLLCLVWGLGGWKWTAIVAGTVLISYQLDQAPTIGWVLLAGMCYVLKAIKNVKLSKLASVSFWVAFVVVAAACVFHSTISMRNALHPQLANRSPTFEESVYGMFARRYTAEEIVQMGITDLSDFFRKIPEQFNSTAPQTSTTFETGDEMEEVIATGSRMLVSDPTALIVSNKSDEVTRLGVIAQEARQTPALKPFDPTLPIAIQTGPGRPRWEWETVTLDWHGPVAQDKQMSFVLLPPWISRVIYGLSALATLLVLAYFAYLKVPGIKNCIKSFLPGASSLASLVLVGVLFCPQEAHAEIPDAHLLDELEKRLLALPDCLNECAYLEEASVLLSDGVLKISMQIHAEDRVAIPLPNENGTWNLVDVRQGTNQLPLLRERSRLYTLLDKGVHEITLTAGVDELDRFDIAFDLIPGHLEIDAPGWRVEGLIRGQVGDRNLSFSRSGIVETASTSPTTSNFIPIEITPYVSVQRQIVLSYEPTVITRVARVAPYSGEITVRIPLLPNEHVSTGGMSVEEDQMVINLKDGQHIAVWESRLEETTAITLSAPSVSERSERWSIIGSDFWSYDYEGVVPIDVGASHTTFIPRSDEVLQVDIQQSQPVPGNSITINSINMFHEVGPQSSTSYLELTILASQPEDIEVTLPEGAKIESFNFAGEYQALPSNDAEIVFVPVQSGSNQYSIDWKTDAGVSMLYRPHGVSFSQPGVNVRTHILLPDNRWILWLAGPSLGGTVIFWSVLIALLFVAVAVSRIPGIALSTRDAVILTLGATLVHLSVLVFVGIWFLAIWLKSRAKQEIIRPWFYRIGQILFGVFTLLVLYIVVSTIVAALTNEPNMYIAGWQSSDPSFAWFSDEIDGRVPSPWVLSLPMWVYFVLILVWAMWLVFTLIKWIKVWWQSFKTPVLWVPTNFRERLRRQKQTVATETTTES